jgi:hypothetical protein
MVCDLRGPFLSADLSRGEGDGSRMIEMLKLASGVLALSFWFSSFFVWKYFDAHRSKIADPNRLYP